MARPQRPAPGSVVLQCLYWSATGPITMHNKPAQLMASHGSADSPGFGGGWGLPHAASWLSRPPQVGGLTGVASCSGERGEQGGESTPPAPRTFTGPAFAAPLASHWPNQVSRPSLKSGVREACSTSVGIAAGHSTEDGDTERGEEWEKICHLSRTFQQKLDGHRSWVPLWPWKVGLFVSSVRCSD